MRLLLTGDIHIGRSSTRVAEGATRGALRASAAWNRIVDLAIDDQVDVLCLSGDIADKENRFWEAIGPLEDGVKRLAGAGIVTVAVSGNHDFEVMRRLSGQLPAGHFHLLGRNGRWERFTIERHGRPVLHIDGWSFPRETVFESPLLSYDLPADRSVPTLGLVHGDLDVAGSIYAPLETHRLTALPPGGWLLGHVHAPSLRPGRPWILYPGSPQALDFGEPGLHGVWMVEVEHGLSMPELRPVSTVRYETLEVDVSDTESDDEVESAILQRARHECERLVKEGRPQLECLMLRLNVVGRTRLSHRIDAITDNLLDDLQLTIEGAIVRVDALRIGTLPDVDVSTYAKAHSAPGAVARLLLALEEPEVSGEVADLIATTKLEIEANDGHKYFAALERREITEELAREVLKQEAKALLTQLVAQTT